MRRESLLWGCTAVAWWLAASMAGAQFGVSVPPVLHPRLAFSPTPAWPGQEIAVAVMAEIDPGWHVNTHRPPLENLIPTEVSFQGPEGWEIGPVEYPPGEATRTILAEEPVPVYHGRVVFRARVKVPLPTPPGEYAFRAQVRYQACNDTQCLPPTTVEAEGTLLVAARGTPQREEAWVAVSSKTPRTQEEGPSAPSSAKEEASSWALLKRGDVAALSRRAGPVLTYLALFVLGLLLNLTPCVWPVVPITLTFFTHRSGGEPRRALGLASLYVLGIALMYSTLGVMAAFGGGLFGAWLQKPIVILFIVQVLVALALSSFGLFELRFPVALTGGGQRGLLLETFLMGLTVGLVAAPCVGPVLLSLMLWVAEIGKPTLGFTAFFVLALGMGLPYLVLGTVAGAAQALPRSGDWLLWVKRLFGFVILGLALYFLEPLLEAQAARILFVELALVAGLVLGWLDPSGRQWRAFGYVKRGTGFLGLALAFWLALPRAHPQGLAWEPFQEARLEQAKAEGKPVIIDFYADWCIPCRRMERTLFVAPPVVREAQRFLLLKADVTRSEAPEVQSLQRRFQVRGVPTVIFLDSQGREVQRLTKASSVEEFVALMRQVR